MLGTGYGVPEGTGSSDKTYYTNSPAVVAGIISRDKNGTKLCYHVDRLGNVMAVTDSDGSATAVYTMEPFGSVLQTGTINGYGTAQSDPHPYHLTTKEYDPGTGLYYFNARWYDAATGRFVSRSHIAPVAEHGYVFVLGNPLRMVDPSGRDPVVVGLDNLTTRADTNCGGTLTGDTGGGSGQFAEPPSACISTVATPLFPYGFHPGWNTSDTGARPCIRAIRPSDNLIRESDLPWHGCLVRDIPCELYCTRF